MIPSLAPIKLPTLKKLWMSDKNSCRKESWTAAMMIYTTGFNFDPKTFWSDDEQTIWIWEHDQNRLWLLGHNHCSVNYFSFETGHPFLWKSESLLKKSRAESFCFDTVQFHLSIGVDYWIPPSGDKLEEQNSIPTLFLDMEKRKVLPAGSRKFIRQFYSQLQFEKLGFKGPELTRPELLSLLVQTTCETTINTVQKIHPEIWRMVCVEGEIKHSEEKSINQEDATTSEDVLVNEKIDIRKDFFIREETGSVTHITQYETQK